MNQLEHLESKESMRRIRVQMEYQSQDKRFG
jgi:hypothetical protein